MYCLRLSLPKSCVAVEELEKGLIVISSQITDRDHIKRSIGKETLLLIRSIHDSKEDD
jgi:hypothetical protein